MKYFPDILLTSGALILSYGAWLVYPPAGFISIGLLMLITGLKASK
jgi:hypothetical protein